MIIFRFSVEFFLLFSIILICIDCNDAKLTANGRNFNFENILDDIFSKSEFNTSTRDGFNDGDLECLDELFKIQNGLKNFEPWALKLVDAWAKIPSTVLSGNLFEFGGFSECFHIEREQELYKTQYCLGYMIVDFNGGLIPKSQQGNTGLFPINIGADNEPTITPRMILPQSEKKPSITFGLCIPSTCSSKVIEPIINKIIQSKVRNITIELKDNNCQFDENAIEWRTMDKVAFGLLVAVFCLILASTSYDIICSINHHEKIETLLAFSFYTNGSKLLSYKKSKSSDVMQCINGIRVITTAWVVLGHVFLMYSTFPTRNKASFATFASKYQNMIINAAPIAVDTFFLLSGLFVTISMLKHLEKTKGKLNVPILYFHRYLRLTPLLGMTILFSVTLLRFLGNGPLWPSLMKFFGGQCERNWWSALFYVQNYYNPNDICLTHTWYLSVDFQLFLIAPLVVYSIHQFKAKVIPVWIIFILGCIGCTLAIHLKYNYTNLLTGKNIMGNAYIPTHTRYSSWLIGVITGYFFHEVRGKTIRIPRIFNLLLWVVSLASLITVIIAYYPFPQPDSKATALEFGLYEALSRVLWSIALSYIIFACVHGYGGPINCFLAHPLWQPLSRLSYSIYLVHFPVIILITGTMKTPQYFTEFTAFHSFIGTYVIIVFVSIIATLAFESPIIIIEKLIFGSRPKKDGNKVNAVHENRIEVIQNQHSGTHSS